MDAPWNKAPAMGHDVASANRSLGAFPVNDTLPTYAVRC